MYQHILAAVDLAADSERVANRAARLANALDARLSLVFVEPGVGDLSLMDIELQLDSSHDELLKHHKQRLQQLATRLDHRVTDRVVASGDIARQILATQAQLGADLIVVGEHHSFWHLTHADRSVVRSAACDVLTVKF